MIFNPETTTCVFTHPTIQGIYYCEDADNGLTQDLNQASKYYGAASRKRGIKSMQERFPRIKDGAFIIFYLNSM